MHRLTHSAQHMGVHQVKHALGGHPAGLLAIGGLWLAGKAVHMLQKPWNCKACNHDFA